MSAPVPLEAAEGAAEQAVNVSIIPPINELIPATIAFLILIFVLVKYAFPPILKMLDERTERIRESLEKAEEARIEAERLLEDYKAQLAEARKEAQTVLAEAKSAAEAMRNEATGRAQAEAETIIEKARVAIEGEKRAAVAELQASVATLTVSVAGKLIGSELSAEDHLKVVEKYLAEAGSLNAN